MSDVDTVDVDSALNKLLNWVADYRKRGVIAKAKPEGDKSYALAWYAPDLADVTVDLEAYKKQRPFFLASEFVRNVSYQADYNERETLSSSVIEIGGLLAHEAAHSMWSGWTMEVDKLGIDKQTGDTMVFFEEARIEKRAVDNSFRPNLITRLLRGSVSLILEEIPTEYASVASLGYTWGLINGRYRSGIITLKEFGEVDNAARTVIGDEIVDLLVDLMDEAMGLNVKRDMDRFIEVAQEWNALLAGDSEDGDQEVSDALDDMSTCESPSEGESDSAPGDGEASEDGEESKDGEASEDGSGDADSETTSDDDSEGHAADDGGNSDKESRQTGDSEKAPNIDVDDLMKDAVESLKSESKKEDWTERIYTTYPSAKAAQEIFGKKATYRGSGRRGEKWLIRKPTAREINASNALARHLENLSIPTIDSASYRTATPTGRLRTREAVRASADRAQGRMTNARPWVGKRRQHTTAAPVIVGIATDTSGSMSWAERMVASAAFIVGHAGTRINARTAAITFGSDVDAILNPEEVPTEVRQRTADGGEEKFDKAIAALDGVLNYTSADGVKLLIVISDNDLVIDGEPARRALWLAKLKKAGVVTIWVNRYSKNVPDAENVGIDSYSDDPMVLVNVITKAIDKAFAGRRSA